MELGKQIKNYRNERSLSQEALAERVFVSRQMISNWENDKSYPDVNSLVILSEVFNVSLDQLIKGDVEEMKEKIKEINENDQKRFERLSNVFAILFFAVMILPIPLEHFLSTIGLGIWGIILVAALYVTSLVEKEKKKLDIRTYREIVAFMNGESLNELEKAKEEGKRGYQQAFQAVLFALLTIAVNVFFIWLLGI